MNAGCSLEDSCPPDQFKAFREAHPDHIALTYINSSAEVKALSDIIVTSSSAETILSQIPKEQKIIFGPDKHLGGYLARKTRPRHAALAGRLHRPRGLLRDRAAQAQGAASRRAGARPSRMPAAHHRPCRLCRLDLGRSSNMRCESPSETDDRRHRAAHHPPDGEGGAATRPSSARPARTATATATCAPIWRSTRWRSSTSRLRDLQPRIEMEEGLRLARQEVARPDARNGRRHGRQGRCRPAADQRGLISRHSSESWNLTGFADAGRKEIPAFAGMTEGGA